MHGPALLFSKPSQVCSLTTRLYSSTIQIDTDADGIFAENNLMAAEAGDVDAKKKTEG